MSFDEIDCALVLESRTIYQKPQDLFLYGISNHACVAFFELLLGDWILPPVCPEISGGGKILE